MFAVFDHFLPHSYEFIRLHYEEKSKCSVLKKAYFTLLLLDGQNTWKGRCCWCGRELVATTWQREADSGNRASMLMVPLLSCIHHLHSPLSPPTQQKGMHTSEAKFNFSCSSNSISAQVYLFRAEQKPSADGTGMHGLQSPQSLTDLWVEGRRCCARAADKLHKEGPVLKSEEEEAAAAAANARERRDECGPVMNHQGKERGMKEKNKNKNKEGRRETRAHEGNGEETKREREKAVGEVGGRGGWGERSTQKDYIQMQSISRNSHLPRQNVPSVWEQTQG